MAAQERAKNAQLKQASSVAPAAPTSVEFEKEKMMRALNGITSETVQKNEEPLPVIHTNKFTPPPMSFTAPPMVKAPQPPPPSFDIFEKQMAKMSIQPPAPVASAPATAMVPPPPAFESIATQIFQQQQTHPVAPPPPPTLSASDADLLGGNFGGVMPMAPPSVSAPSFDQVMQQNLMGDPQVQAQEMDFELDENGMKLSPEEKQRMVEEQRAIMEQIERQKRENKASEAAIKADAFANRMTSASGPQTMMTPPAMGVDGFSASEIEEQRKILEQIEAARSGSEAASSSTNTNTGTGKQKIDIGNGQSVELHDQEKTKAAIKEGTAQLVLCLNCNNWMQVVGSATLMYCPICSSVTPVVKQDAFMSQEEVMQMEEDRKMAEMLQAQENAAAAEDGGVTSRSAGAASNDKSWWGTLNDALVSVGMASPEEKDPSEMSVSRPPGSGPRTLHSAVTGEERTERVGLLADEGYGGGGDGKPAARMAQPTSNLFSCMVDSVSNTAAAAGSYLVGDEDSDEEVHGVDSTSFLSVPNVGRDKNNGGSGNYFAIPPNE